MPSSEVREVILNEDVDDSTVVSGTDEENGTAGVHEEKSEIEELTKNGVDEMREAENFEKYETEISESDQSLVRV